jgi:hypothetical protein
LCRHSHDAQHYDVIVGIVLNVVALVSPSHCADFRDKLSTFEVTDLPGSTHPANYLSGGEVFTICFGLL